MEDRFERNASRGINSSRLRPCGRRGVLDSHKDAVCHAPKVPRIMGKPMTAFDPKRTMANAFFARDGRKRA